MELLVAVHTAAAAPLLVLDTSTIESLTTPVDSPAVGVSSEGNAGPKLKRDDGALRGRAAAEEPPRVDPPESVSVNGARKTTDPSRTATAKPARAERADSADRTSTAGTGAERKSPKADGAKADGAKDKKRNDG